MKVKFIYFSFCYIYPRTSLLREVLKKCSKEGVKKSVLTRSKSQEEVIQQLKKKKHNCDNIIKIIIETEAIIKDL